MESFASIPFKFQRPVVAQKEVVHGIIVYFAEGDSTNAIRAVAMAAHADNPGSGGSPVEHGVGVLVVRLRAIRARNKPIEQILKRSWDNTIMDGVCFAGSSLAIGEESDIDASKRIVQQLRDSKFVKCRVLALLSGHTGIKQGKLLGHECGGVIVARSRRRTDDSDRSTLNGYALLVAEGPFGVIDWSNAGNDLNAAWF